MPIKNISILVSRTSPPTHFSDSKYSDFQLKFVTLQSYKYLLQRDYMHNKKITGHEP